jgi:O-antigen/teichoic acid export membrane protein
VTIKETAIKGTLIIGAGRMIDRALQLLRNIIVARLVSPEDFGIAALFVMTVSFLEMISNLAVDTLLIQSPLGEESSFQKTSQLMMAARGFGVALMLLLFAEPAAKLFDISKATWAFRLLAVVPLIRGLAHQDMIRFQRKLNFKPVLITDVSSQLISVSIAWPLAVWLGDYSAILYLIIVQNLARTVVSHIMAERSYTWGWEPIHARQIIKFGWPLLINGVLLFLIMQGDRFVIGAADNLFERETYSKTLLGFYSAAFVLSAAIFEGIYSVLTPVMLPLLSSVQEFREQFQKRYRFCILIAASISGPLGIFFILMGGWLMVLVYGDQYLAGTPLIIWLGATQSIRLLRSASITIALSKGDSTNPTISNMFRAFSFALAFIFAARGADIVWIAASSLVGELLATVVSISMLKYRLAIPIKYFLLPFILSLTGLILAAVFWNVGLSKASSLFGFSVAAFLSICMTALFLLFYPDFRKEIDTIIRPLLMRKIPKS